MGASARLRIRSARREAAVVQKRVCGRLGEAAEEEPSRSRGELRVRRDGSRDAGSGGKSSVESHDVIRLGLRLGLLGPGRGLDMVRA